ncbi:hypothetical protein A3G56_02675 [Candidatus Falkowbacteria bacterium RIFCSPLOWO2_12_FULL_45_10]|uniref:Addiction module toxin, HicA family n=3 Tax=Candidatus Falkowiibacteriota TaxID=1752728 RepID=A0A1F5RWF2_9BACT|nr:MAG: hypothetical protein A3D54_04065 [Candidatus Falkowbacteria bacterium RIFCSPHIGHO2_02_FULL_45_15]OGF18819.1 MAG: hypothetical protein A3I35_03650 [Candidatus Falkowbacteria bacterium RIFCSPLOWO2_02_FULL_45_15]OGF19228.1 MAG: hypothetical protein A3G56_02675 [Candidatus Falkowbacteria bacterium RIFCSPLOWO2_12_FULL_45_10]
MPKPYPLRIVLKVLASKGFIFISQRGSHAKYRKEKENEAALTVIVPAHEKEIRYGTFRSILRQSKLKESDFKKK